MDIKRVRDYMKMSQSEFSEFWGININTLQNWEQGRSQAPDYLENFFFKYFELETKLKAEKKAFDKYVGYSRRLGLDLSRHSTLIRERSSGSGRP